MCFLLGSMVACLLVRYTSRERSRDMVHHNCLDSLTAGLKQTLDFCMIANLYYDYTRGFRDRSVALPLSLSWLTRVLSTLPQFPHGWALVPMPVAGPRHTDAHFTPSKIAILEHFVRVGYGNGSEFMHLLQTGIHCCTAQATTLRSSKSASLPPIDHANAF
jgi:hypothetical protein